MQHDDASFWADIKNYEEQLSKTPDSYIFARLSEVYLKVGLVDDALYTARQGVVSHPGYIAGQRSLALASHAKGLLDESCEALKIVTTALPEDREAQILLGRLLFMSGNITPAEKAFRTVLEFNPDDLECRLELELMERSSSSSDVEFSQLAAMQSGVDEYICDQQEMPLGVYEEDIGEYDEIIDDVEILEMDESDLLEDEEADSDIASPFGSVTTTHDPLSTVTLAELYVKQGFNAKALEIYRDILADDPANSDVQLRIVKLMNEEQSELEIPQDVKPGEDKAVVSMFHENMSDMTLPPAQGKADDAVSVLEGWLDNIRRMKACR